MGFEVGGIDHDRVGFSGFATKTIQAAFGANYERLQAVKKKYDPTNFFRVNQNVEPAGKG